MTSKKQRRKDDVSRQQKQGNIQWIAGGVIGLLAVILVVFALLRQETPESTMETGSTASERVAAEVGAVAPDFELPALDGSLVRLSDYRGKPVAVTFMHTW